MRRLYSVLGILAVLVASMGFAGLNGAQRITVRLGFATFYRVPLPVVAFGALILGMLIMLFAGIASDLRVRRILRERLAEEDREERARMFVDRDQTSLFEDTDGG
ncbi:MAG: LapA family protein [Gemmatimonadales bacterium]|nr:MAG: LapA family protein [Gemmatimonadales bacterium]